MSDIIPVPLTPTPRSLDLFYTLVQKTTLSDGSFKVLHTDPDFDWENESSDHAEEENTGNAGVSVERLYHKAGILLIHADFDGRLLHHLPPYRMLSVYCKKLLLLQILIFWYPWSLLDVQRIAYLAIALVFCPQSSTNSQN